MKKRALFLDLDGTLLQMKENEFLDAYIGDLCAFMKKKMEYDSSVLQKELWAGMKAMYFNDGIKKNEDIFFDVYVSMHGSRHPEEEYFLEFYHNEFDKCKRVVYKNEYLKSFIEYVKERFDVVVLATNPVFPRIATEKRINWAGLKPDDFDLITTYENSSFCKPNPKYFEELLRKLSLTADEVLMIGNNDKEDYECAKKAKIDCLIIDDYRIFGKEINDDIIHMKFSRLEDYLKENY